MLEMNQIFNKLATETVLKQSKATNSIEIHPPFRYLFFFFLPVKPVLSYFFFSLYRNLNSIALATSFALPGRL